jgi:hypothetical protein
MSSDRDAAANGGAVSYGAAAGAVAVLLFLLASLVIGDGPGSEAPGSEVAAFYADKRTEIQIGCALFALSAPFWIWFLATVVSLARSGGRGAELAGTVAFGCGLAFFALFLADVTTLAVGALRPESMAADPELARALRDFEFLAMGMAAFLVAGMLAAFAVLALRENAIWPRWLGWLAALAAAAYALRAGTLFTVEEPFSASGVLGLWVPVAPFAAWTLIAGTVLAIERHQRPGGHQS